MLSWFNDVFDFREATMACAPSVPSSLPTIIMAIHVMIMKFVYEYKQANML